MCEELVAKTEKILMATQFKVEEYKDTFTGKFYYKIYKFSSIIKNKLIE